VLPDEPLVAGCDFAWGGSDDNMIRVRAGWMRGPFRRFGSKASQRATRVSSAQNCRGLVALWSGRVGADLCGA